jgi:hypothetical protein
MVLNQYCVTLLVTTFVTKKVVVTYKVTYYTCMLLLCIRLS